MLFSFSCGTRKQNHGAKMQHNNKDQRSLRSKNEKSGPCSKKGGPRSRALKALGSGKKRRRPMNQPRSASQRKTGVCEAILLQQIAFLSVCSHLASSRISSGGRRRSRTSDGRTRRNKLIRCGRSCRGRSRLHCDHIDMDIAVAADENG